ncbi:hypothetical protein OKA05_12645 [Luteolibacter arcticus]|uniref:LamG-like jellyroll fold domain-containing protein n=1 Tax=Luteolibacter arcticus TaxID=1581411 RepID=A0ABT3GIU5_9BACT|nr:LamG-like jellyroll fold domain-containing protein [Luteolibacter arcticus]MCW1923406.1 hypothetical protein [Luteolibacter arcticus]
MKSEAFRPLLLVVSACWATTAPVLADSLVAVALSDGNIDEYYVAKGTFNAAATWSRVRTIANVPGIFAVTYNPSDDCFYATVTTASLRKVVKITRAGLVSDLVIRGTGTTGWTNADPQGIEVGPDGKLYFSTAFGGGANVGNGVFSLTTAGGSFTQVIPVSGTGFTLANARDLIWSGGNLYVASRNSNAVYKFSSAGVYQSTLTTAATGATALAVDGTTLLVTTNVAAPNSLRKIDAFATAPVLGQLTTTGKSNGLEIGLIEGQRNYLTFNQGTGGAGDINRLNADGSSTPMVAFNTPTVRTANDFVVYPDVDSEPDGLPDSWEIAKLGDISQGPGGNTDGDTLTHGEEYAAGTNPASPDTDGDGVADGTEANRLVSGSPAPTNPTLADTDGDGLTDNRETHTGTFVSLADTGTNPLAADSDGDTFADYVEIARASDPNLVGSVPGTSAPSPIVRLDASALAAGPLSSWGNLGTIGSTFNVETLDSPVVQTIHGVKGVTFSGDDVLVGMAAPPVLTGNSSRTITAWIFNPTVASEETILTWGRRDGPNSTNASFLHGTSTTFGAAGQWGADADMPWGDDAFEIGEVVKAGRWTYLAYTYDAAAPRQGTVYVDGVLTRQETFASVLATWAVDNTNAARPLPFRIGGNTAANGSLSATGGVNASLTISKVEILDRALTPAELGIADSDGDGIPAWWETFYGLSDSNGADASLQNDSDSSNNLQEFTAGTNPLAGDTDGDGLQDHVETRSGSFAGPSSTGTDPLKADTDGDGLLDGAETGDGTFVSTTQTGTDPNVADTDSDGLSDGLEVLTYVTNPLANADKDGDTLVDGDEVNIHGTNPSLVDTDGDTFNDNVEIAAASDPLVAVSTPSNLPGYSGALIHRFKFDETAGTSAADSESANVGTIGTDVILGQSGRDGNAVTFPAIATANSKVLLPSSLIPTGASPFTFSTWVRLAGPLANGAQLHFLSANNGQAGRWNFGVYDADATAAVDARLFWFHNGGVGQLSAVAGFNFNDHLNEWVHVTVARSGTGLTDIYINGASASDPMLALSSKAALSASTQISVGSRPLTLIDQVNGKVDDLRFYDGGLSPANVLALYQSYPALNDYDAWAAGYGIDPSGPNGGSAEDFDGDGTANGVEFALDLDPTSGASRFAITITGTAATGLTLTWPSAEGISFQVKSSIDLLSFPVLEATIVGQASQTTATWTTPPASELRKFYRVEFNP